MKTIWIMLFVFFTSVDFGFSEETDSLLVAESSAQSLVDNSEGSPDSSAAKSANAKSGFDYKLLGWIFFIPIAGLMLYPLVFK